MFCQHCGANLAEGSVFCNNCGKPAAAAVAGGVAVAAAVAAQQRYAGFWLRFVALIIDGIVLNILFYAVLIVLGVFGMAAGLTLDPERLERMQPEAMMAVLFPLIGMSVVLQWLYFALMESSAWQATLGKKALGLAVTGFDGQRISFARATGRYFGKLISNMTLGIGYIMAGFTARKQALHDMLADCLVVRQA